VSMVNQDGEATGLGKSQTANCNSLDSMELKSGARLSICTSQTRFRNAPCGRCYAAMLPPGWIAIVSYLVYIECLVGVPSTSKPFPRSNAKQNILMREISFIIVSSENP